MQRHHIRTLQHLVHGGATRHLVSGGKRLVPVRVAADDVHAEGAGAHRHLLADAAEANDAEGKAYRSIIYAREFNCRKEQSRILSWQRKSESMGNGAVVSEHSQVSEWTDVKTPNAKRLMMAACEQR